MQDKGLTINLEPLVAEAMEIGLTEEDEILEWILSNSPELEREDVIKAIRTVRTIFSEEEF